MLTHSDVNNCEKYDTLIRNQFCPLKLTLFVIRTEILPRFIFNIIMIIMNISGPRILLVNEDNGFTLAVTGLGDQQTHADYTVTWEKGKVGHRVVSLWPTTGMHNCTQ